ncbi:MAG: hypothetical protein K0S37_1984 [Microbacterium sp.]|jgi:hypothetical protein|nr:hypothetical protein [Microbacterium sp.]
MPYTPPVFKDNDPRYPVVDEKLNALGQQYQAVAEDATDTTTPVGFAIAQAASAAGGGGLIEDPTRPGTFIITNPGAISENPERPGTFVIGGTA